MPGKFRYWNNKNVRSRGEARGGSLRMKRNGAGNWWAHRGKGSSILKQDERKKLLRDEGWSLDIETKWRYMKKNAERRRGNFWDRKMNAGRGWGNLDIETRCMQEGVERNGGTCRYWLKPGDRRKLVRKRQVGSLWEGKLDTKTRMNARSCWDEKQKSRYWTQMMVHARSCGETRGSWDIETAWMREAVERHRWGGL